MVIQYVGGLLLQLRLTNGRTQLLWWPFFYLCRPIHTLLVIRFLIIELFDIIYWYGIHCIPYLLQLSHKAVNFGAFIFKIIVEGITKASCFRIICISHTLLHANQVLVNWKCTHCGKINCTRNFAS